MRVFRRDWDPSLDQKQVRASVKARPSRLLELMVARAMSTKTDALDREIEAEQQRLDITQSEGSSDVAAARQRMIERMKNAYKINPATRASK